MDSNPVVSGSEKTIIVNSLIEAAPQQDIEWSARSRETPEEAQHRRDMDVRREEERAKEAAYRRSVDTKALIAGFVVFMIIAAAGGYGLITGNDGFKHECLAALSAEFTAFLGFLAGKKVSAPEPKS